MPDVILPSSASRSIAIQVFVNFGRSWAVFSLFGLSWSLLGVILHDSTVHIASKLHRETISQIAILHVATVRLGNDRIAEEEVHVHRRDGA